MRRAMAIALPQADIERIGIAHMGRLLSGSTLRVHAPGPRSGPTLKTHAAGPPRRVVERREHLGAVSRDLPNLPGGPAGKRIDRAPAQGKERLPAHETGEGLSAPSPKLHQSAHDRQGPPCCTPSARGPLSPRTPRGLAAAEHLLASRPARLTGGACRKSLRRVPRSGCGRPARYTPSSLALAWLRPVVFRSGRALSLIHI